MGLIIVIGPNLEGEPRRFFVFFTTLLAVYFITDVLKILLSKHLQKKLTPAIFFNFKKTVGAVIVVSGIVLIVKGFLLKEQLNATEIIKGIGQ